MSKVKSDLMKEIEAKVIRKKQFSKQAARQKTIASWVTDFFIEYEKMKKLDQSSIYSSFTSLALSRLNIQLRTLDRKCSVVFKEPEDNSPTIEIHWSSAFIQKNSCEETLVFDASSAFFQSAMEDI
jgi:ribosomal protein S26